MQLSFRSGALSLSVLVVAWLMMGTNPACANLIVNGSFETPDIPTGTFQIFPSIPGWSTTFGSGIEIQDHVAGSPFVGAQHVELDSNDNSGMSQVVSTVPGQTYHLSFAYSPRPGVSADSNIIQVFFNGVQLDSLALSGVGLQDTFWQVFGYNVVPSVTSSTLEFRAAGVSDTLGGYLDDVQFDRNVSEPSTLMLFGVGSLALVGFGRWRKKAA
jgi:PEP-CTERM motif